MALPYDIRVDITRERARDLINRLIVEPEFRRRFEADTRAVLSEYGIEVSPEALPERVRLPEPDAIREFLSVADTRIDLQPDTPYGLMVVICAFGAMPVLVGDRPVLDGSG
jgi:hypothetical protein